MRYAVVVLLAALLFAQGCGREGGKEGVVLTVWETYSAEERAIFMSWMDRYMKAHPGLSIEVTNIPFDGMEPKILTSLATETAPDIARVDVAFLPKLAIRGALQPLDQYDIAALKEELRPVALSSCIVDGQTYGLPDQVNGLCLFYNRDLFEQAGLDPDVPPENWEEFVEFAEKLTDPAKGVFGFGMRNSLWWSLPFIYSYGGRILNEDNTKCALSSEAAIAGFQFKVDLYAKYKVEGGAWRSGGIRDDLGFQNRKYAMIFNGPWAVGGLTRGGIPFGVALVPEGPVGRTTNVGGNNLVVFSTSKHPKEACELLKFVASKEAQAEWANALGQIPVNRASDPMIDFAKHPYLKVFMEQMEYAIPRPGIGSYPEIENAVNPEMQAALDGKKSVRDAMVSACQEVDRIMAEEEALKASLKK
jgi:multiple sugar transport system substrate-binding protein